LTACSSVVLFTRQDELLVMITAATTAWHLVLNQFENFKRAAWRVS
jgi:hypothetical protein